MVTFFKLFHVSAPLWDLVAIHSRPMAVPSEGSSFVPSDGRALSKEAGTQTLDADWKSLKSWLPQNGSKKEGKGVKAKHSTKLEVRVWQWLFRREKFRGSCQENVSALAKVWKRK